jgi:hypothetical protein
VFGWLVVLCVEEGNKRKRKKYITLYFYVFSSECFYLFIGSTVFHFILCSLLTTMAPPSMHVASWTVADVHEWLIDLGLEDLTPLFKRTTGRTLVAIDAQLLLEQVGGDIEARNILWTDLASRLATTTTTPTTTTTTTTTAPCISCTAVLECISPETISSSKGATNELAVTIQNIPLPARKRVLILMVDMSASMRPAFAQVQEALIYIVGRSFDKPNITVEVVLYNRHSARIVFDRDSYVSQLTNRRANGGTCFASAFETTHTVAKYYIDNDVSGQVDIAIGFMTDGRHTSQRRPLESFNRLQALLHSARGSTVVHCIGFTANHRFEELDRIRCTLGKSSGSFQFCEMHDGPQALRARMEALFEFISNYGIAINVQAFLAGFKLSTLRSNALRDSTTDTCAIDSACDNSGSFAHTLFAATTDPSVLANTAAAPLVLELTISSTELPSSPVVQYVLCHVSDITGIAAQHLALVQCLEHDLEHLFTQITQHSPESPPSPEQLSMYQSELARVKQCIKPNEALMQLPSKHRAPIMRRNASIHARLSELLELVADFARGAWSNANKYDTHRERERERERDRHYVHNEKQSTMPPY